MQKRINRETMKMVELLGQIENPEQLLEKEYHFDEGMGVSLADHMATLRKQYPNAQVLSRRDRDGYAIVKVSFKPEYKYDIETLTQFNKEEAQRKFMQDMEEILARATGGKGLNESHINVEALQEEIKHLTSGSQMVP